MKHTPLRWTVWTALLLGAVLASGCAPTRGPAPVEDRRPARVVTPAAKPPAAKAPTTAR